MISWVRNTEMASDPALQPTRAEGADSARLSPGSYALLNQMPQLARDWVW
jgi:hypothetical protein